MPRLSLFFLGASVGLALAQAPDFPPSYEVHISPAGAIPAGTSNTTSGNYWRARGYTLQAMMAEAWHVNDSRIEIAAGVDAGKHYDFAMVLPKPEDRETIYRYVREAIPRQFHVQIARESQPKDVYVMTVPNGLSPAVRILPKVTNGIVSGGVGLTSRSLSAHGATMAELGYLLESMLGRLVVDDTNVEERFDVEVEVEGTGRGKDALIALLRDKLGVVLTADRRPVEMLVVR